MVAQIIAVVNQSGKVIKTSKTLVSIFNEAKSAYNGKKAELKAQRLLSKSKEKDRSPSKEGRIHGQLEGLTLVDGQSVSLTDARRSFDGAAVRRKPVAARHDRPPAERGISDSFYINDDRSSPSRRSSARLGPELDDPRSKELTRRHTDMGQLTRRSLPNRVTRSASMDDIDMDLAYGELPPPLPLRKGQDTLELREKMTALQTLLEECNCIQHSVTATIDKLSKNPDAMAAVALTLAEISGLASKLAPGALTAMKGSFPAIVAMLASPQFAIAVGVGVGITVIAFGSYKIIKKIQQRREDDRMLLAYGEDNEGSIADSVDEIREISRIEHWRRGITDAEINSVGTSVDGELVTPMATRTLIEEGKLKESDLKSKTSSRRSKKHRSSKSDDSKTSRSKTKSTAKPKKKEPSGLRKLFK